MELLKRIQEDVSRLARKDAPMNLNTNETDQFLESYREIIEKVAVKSYPKDEFLSFEKEMEYFYERLVKIRYSTKNDLYYCIHQLFCGISTYYIYDYDLAYDYFQNANQASRKLKLKYISSVIQPFLRQLKIILKKERILILVSHDGDPDKWVKAAQKWLSIFRAYIKNYYVRSVSTQKFESLENILKTAVDFDFVFFVGHGDEYFGVVTKKGEELLTPKKIVGIFDKFEKRPKLFAALSCPYEKYNEFALSGYFDYFLLSANSGDEHSERFIKAFIYALDVNRNIINSIHLARLALMCGISGPNQMEVYQNNEKIYP